ncbi:MAG: RNA polymerase sigma factor [Acidimicrobiales bacterium]
MNPPAANQPQAGNSYGAGFGLGTSTTATYLKQGASALAITAREIDQDATLVLAVQGGDTAAFSELFRRHYQSVRRACARRLLDVAEAEEVAQATFVRALERIDQCGGERNFGAWVQVIGHRLCMDTIRSRSRVTPQEEPVRADRPAAADGPEESVLGGERRRHLAIALSTLPERQRQVVIEREIDDHRPGEIAAGLGVTVGAVDSLLLRAKARLKTVYMNVASEQGLATAPTASAAAATVGMGGAALVEPRSVAAAAAAVGRVAGSVAAAAQGVAIQAARLTGALPGAGPGPGHGLLAAVVAATAIATGGAGAGADQGARPGGSVGRPAVVAPVAPAPSEPGLGAPAEPSLSPVPPVPVAPGASGSEPSAPGTPDPSRLASGGVGSAPGGDLRAPGTPRMTAGPGAPADPTVPPAPAPAASADPNGVGAGTPVAPVLPRLPTVDVGGLLAPRPSNGPTRPVTSPPPGPDAPSSPPDAPSIVVSAPIASLASAAAVVPAPVLPPAPAAVGPSASPVAAPGH